MIKIQNSKFKIQSCNLKFKILILILLFTLHFSFFTSAILAEESTQSASPSATFQAKLKALQEEIASKAAQFKNEVGRKLQNKAYVGFVRTVTSTSLDIETNIATKSAKLNEFTEILSKGKKIKNVALGDYVAALGDIDEVDNLIAKKIIKLTPSSPAPKTIFGKVLNIDSKNIIIQNKEKQNVNLLVNADTTYKSASAKEVGIKDITPGREIIIVATPAKSEVLQTRFIYILLPANPTP